jgi:G3E family GTPase
MALATDGDHLAVPPCRTEATRQIRHPMVRLACIGGFLGAGKTTALIAAARELMARGTRVGAITNDQGSHLVDTTIVRDLGLDVTEITHGCFCCRFAEFIASASQLVEQHRPDVILAEAVGSCTDLAATVYAPIQRFHAAAFSLAPLSIFVEPARLRQLLRPVGPFDDSVRYLFEQQIREAELIILSKNDLLDAPESDRLTSHLREWIGNVQVIAMSATTGAGVDEWVSHVLSTSARHDRALDIDYDTYGRAEASLGWLNATVDLVSTKEFSPTRLGETVIEAVRAGCADFDAAIAHVKILLATAHGNDRIALTTNDARPRWDRDASLTPVREASAIINARVATAPDTLRRIVEHALHSATHDLGVRAKMLDLESFAPAPPKRPAHVATTHPLL